MLARQICGEHLVLYRLADGTPVALHDRCSHRGYPLSASARVGDAVQCGYHGLTFDPDGRCTWAPGQERIPSRANITARPLVQRGPWVWVWMGDPDAPDHDRLPAMPWLDHADWQVVHGMEPLAARPSLLIDNLLDLSHETFLHAGYIGTPEVADTPIATTVDDERDVVHVSRRMEAVECPPFYSQTTGLSTPDRSLAGHRVPRARLLPAARARRARRLDAERRRHRSRCRAGRGAVRDHAGRRSSHARLLGGVPRLRHRRPGGRHVHGRR